MADTDCGVFVVNFTLFPKDYIIDTYVLSRSDLYIGYCLLPVIVCFGLCSNFSFVLTFARTRWMRTTLYVYLLHLALVDIAVLVTAFSQRLIAQLISPFNFSVDAFGGASCMVSLLIDLLYYVSLCVVTAISVERYFAICHPMMHIRGSTKKRTAVTFAVVWLFSFIVIALQSLQKIKNQEYCVFLPDDEEFADYPNRARNCEPVVAGYSTVFHILQLLVFYICLIVNIYCYGAILKTLKERSGVDSYSKPSTSGDTVKQAQEAATRMIIVNGSVYFLCNSPSQIYLTLQLFLTWIGHPLSLSRNASSVLFSVLQVLIYVNSSINPIIYGFTNRKYRQATVRALGCGAGDDQFTRGTSTAMSNITTASKAY